MTVFSLVPFSRSTTWLILSALDWRGVGGVGIDILYGMAGAGPQKLRLHCGRMMELLH